MRKHQTNPNQRILRKNWPIIFESVRVMKNKDSKMVEMVNFMCILPQILFLATPHSMQDLPPPGVEPVPPALGV